MRANGDRMSQASRSRMWVDRLGSIFKKKTAKQVLLIVWTWCKRIDVRGNIRMIRVDEI